MKYLVHSIQSKGLLVLVYLANLFLSFHYFTTAYINSSFLSGLVSQQTISLLYITASIGNIIIFIYASHILKLIGNYRFTLAIVIIDLLAVIGLSFITPSIISIALFLIHQMLVPILLFNLDIFLEHCTKDEGITGQLRAAFLTVTNIALVLSPLIIATLGITDRQFENVYLLSAMFLVPVLLITAISLRHFIDPKYTEFKFALEWGRFVKNRSVFAVFIANFLLQLFYSFMVIYMPVYLNLYLHFSWTDIGIMLSIALLPFVLFEMPIGALADHFFGEKEMMGIGFLIIAGALIFIPFTPVLTFISMTIIMFVARIGAALVEITTESYFFKQTKEIDADLMSIFRVSRPFSYVIGPALGFTLLSLSSMPAMFGTLGIIMLSGIYFVGQIVDSK
jgi:MFS family permease